MKRFLRREDGLVAVEFALVGPIFIILLTGMISFGWIYGISSSLQRLSADAARAALVGTTQTERMALATTAVWAGVPSFPLLKQSRITVAVVPVATPMAGVRVSLTYDLTGTQAAAMMRVWGAKTATITRGAYVAW